MSFRIESEILTKEEDDNADYILAFLLGMFIAVVVFLRARRQRKSYIDTENDIQGVPLSGSSEGVLSINQEEDQYHHDRILTHDSFFDECPNIDNSSKRFSASNYSENKPNDGAQLICCTTCFEALRNNPDSIGGNENSYLERGWYMLKKSICNLAKGSLMKLSLIEQKELKSDNDFSEIQQNIPIRNRVLANCPICGCEILTPVGMQKVKSQQNGKTECETNERSPGESVKVKSDSFSKIDQQSTLPNNYCENSDYKTTAHDYPNESLSPKKEKFKEKSFQYFFDFADNEQKDKQDTSDNSQNKSLSPKKNKFKEKSSQYFFDFAGNEQKDKQDTSDNSQNEKLSPKKEKFKEKSFQYFFDFADNEQKDKQDTSDNSQNESLSPKKNKFKEKSFQYFFSFADDEQKDKQDTSEILTNTRLVGGCNAEKIHENKDSEKSKSQKELLEAKNLSDSSEMNANRNREKQGMGNLEKEESNFKDNIMNKPLCNETMIPESFRMQTIPSFNDCKDIWITVPNLPSSSIASTEKSGHDKQDVSEKKVEPNEDKMEKMSIQDVKFKNQLSRNDEWNGKDDQNETKLKPMANFTAEDSKQMSLGPYSDILVEEAKFIVETVIFMSITSIVATIYDEENKTDLAENNTQSQQVNISPQVNQDEINSFETNLRGNKADNPLLKDLKKLDKDNDLYEPTKPYSDADNLIASIFRNIDFETLKEKLDLPVSNKSEAGVNSESDTTDWDSDNDSKKCAAKQNDKIKKKKSSVSDSRSDKRNNLENSQNRKVSNDLNKINLKDNGLEPCALNESRFSQESRQNTIPCSDKPLIIPNFNSGQPKMLNKENIDQLPIRRTDVTNPQTVSYTSNSSDISHKSPLYSSMSSDNSKQKSHPDFQKKEGISRRLSLTPYYIVTSSGQVINVTHSNPRKNKRKKPSRSDS